MSLLPRWLGGSRSRSETDSLRDQLANLQTALGQCRAVVQHWAGLRYGLTTTIAALSLAVGFVLGVYNEPIRQSAAGLVWALGLGGPDREAGYAAYEKGRYGTALALLRPLAEQGDARAQASLGLMYASGNGVQRDDVEAAGWFRRAAEQGNALGQFQLGLLYAKGQGMPQDYTEATKWYHLAANQRYPQAQYELGFLYASGDDGPTDYVTAHMWFNLAAANFAASDTRNRRAASFNREAVESKMTREQIAEAQRRAREWKPN